MRKEEEQNMNEYSTLKKYFLRSAKIFLPLILLLWVMTSQTRFQECTSASIEGVGYLLVIRNLPFKRGDIVSIQGHDTDYFKGKTLAKRVIGLPGDQILHHKKYITVLAPSHLLNQPSHLPYSPGSFPLLEKTTDGDSLTPLSVKTIPKGYIFVAGDHPRSFDSRYEEFGLVPVEKVWGKAIFAW